MQLWINWPRCEIAVQHLPDAARRNRRPFVVAGLRKLLALAGVVGRHGAIALDVAPPWPLPAARKRKPMAAYRFGSLEGTASPPDESGQVSMIG